MSAVDASTAARDAGATTAQDAGADAGDTEFVAAASDFTCLTGWRQVGAMRIANARGHLDEAIAVAQAGAPGRPFPTGTIIQIVPMEASVKRGGGFSPDSNGWEFFSLDASRAGTTIRQRGVRDVTNQFGGNCFSCHEAARDYDFLCQHGHGCVDLPLTDDQLRALQRSDARCPGS